MNFSDLEEWCASELCGMSEARILCILNGQPMLDSSDTSDTDDSGITSKFYRRSLILIFYIPFRAAFLLSQYSFDFSVFLYTLKSWSVIEEPVLPSGPSLEIISDTEEWLTDTEAGIKEEPSSSGAVKLKRVKANSAKNKVRGARKSELEKSRPKLKGKPTTETEVTVKKEKENRGGTNKEGESLLDLLELEMRARAIRALIRKEEDVIPSAASEKRMALTANALRNTLNSAVSASLSNEKSLNGKFSLGESAELSSDKNSVGQLGCSPKRTEAGEDEDVVFVVAQPTPTIELLSSDNDDDNANVKNSKNSKDKKKDEKRDVEGTSRSARQLNKNEKSPEVSSSRDAATVASERMVTINKSGDGPNNLKIVITKRVSESSSSPRSTKLTKSKKLSSDRVDKNVSASGTSGSEKSTEKIIAETTQSAKGMFKKIKKKQHLRSKRKLVCQDAGVDRDQSQDCRNGAMPVVGHETASDKGDDAVTPVQRVTAVKLEIDESKEPKDSALKIDEREVKRKTSAKSDDDRLDDFEEIIDLDAYPEDMDEMENNDAAKSTIKEANVKQNQQTDSQSKTTREEPSAEDPSESTETWASRYYQTDDVQNVIKESKIQSEIRKRLRERQRLSKLNSSPKLNCATDAAAASEKPEEKNEPKPTGSVQEYLALKNATASPVESNRAPEENLTVATEPSDAAVVTTINPTADESEKLVTPESQTIDRSVLL